MKTLLVMIILSLASAAGAVTDAQLKPAKSGNLSPDAAIHWLAAMSENGSPATLCAAARYYHSHPSETKKDAWKLWLHRGTELSKTPQEQTYCEGVQSEIEAQEQATKAGKEAVHAK